MKLPYGISDFKSLILEDYYYADRTNYLPTLEKLDGKYLFYLRPRRFGKSLFISMLHYYYGLEHKNDFQRLFGKLHVGTSPTPLANSYLILKFDFSRIDTSTQTTTFESFLFYVKSSIYQFIATYPTIFNKEDEEKIKITNSPATAFTSLLQATFIKAPTQKVYILIDEYDHFANELVSFDTQSFKDIVMKNGFVRKFYEAIKVYTGQGTVDRLFVTGIAPLTLDSLTSGFNIARDITRHHYFCDMLGFTKNEVTDILKISGVKDEELSKTLTDVKAWYDGYLFNIDCPEKIYNPNMVLYFAANFSEKGEYPDKLLDTNIASDYSKVRKIFNIGNREAYNISLLKELLQNGQIKGGITEQFNLLKTFSRDDFVSIWFYMGILTIQKRQLDGYVFEMPNYVIRQLYYQYFLDITLRQAKLLDNIFDVRGLMVELALNNNIKPIIEYMESILGSLSSRDKQGFNEKHLKILMASIFYNALFYSTHSEFEVNTNSTKKGYVDLLLMSRLPYTSMLEKQFIFELKYLKKSDADKLESIQEEAKVQLLGYLEDEFIDALEGLHAYTVVFVGNKGVVKQISPVKMTTKGNES